MGFLQSIKFAWRSIRGKKGRSILTILSVFIGIASVMTIVSVMEGMKDYTRQMYSALGSNRITVSIYSWAYDEEGNPIKGKDYYKDNVLPMVDIDDSNIFHKAAPNVEGTATFDVLCINYNGNRVDDTMITCAHGYTNNVTGHASTSGPYVHWYTEGEPLDENWIFVEMK